MRKLTSAVPVVFLALAGTLGLTAQHKAPAKAPAKATEPTKLGPGEYATFYTNKGNFTAQLYPKLAPKSVANFVTLAEGKQPYRDPRMGNLSMAPLYNGLLFFRAVPGYMIQTGDPLNNGTGKLGYTIPDETDHLKFDQPGRMALAQVSGEPGSRGSQIFFTLKAVPQLDADGYLVIGQVVQGLNVVAALAEGPHRADDVSVPQFPNILNKVTIQTVP